MKMKRRKVSVLISIQEGKTRLLLHQVVTTYICY